MCTCMHMCIQVPKETRRGHQIPLELEIQVGTGN